MYVCFEDPNSCQNNRVESIFMNTESKIIVVIIYAVFMKVQFASSSMMKWNLKAIIEFRSIKDFKINECQVMSAYENAISSMHY